MKGQKRMGMDLTGKSGNYFRANVWSWRPIHALIEEINEEKHLGLDLKHFGTNDGAGLKTQEECDAVADAIEQRLKSGLTKFELNITDSPMLVDSQTGCFVNRDQIKPRQQVESAYSTDGEHMKEFVTFLRECGGSFEIW